MENLLVTGGAGYIGGHVVRQLSEAGYRPIIFDNLSTGSKATLLYGEKLIVSDLADQERLEMTLRDFRISTVLHFAASIIAPQSVSQPLDYYGNNTCNTLRLLQSCVRTGVEKFVFSSTAAVYGMPESGIAAEDSPTCPINPYGTSKLMSEWMLRDVALAHGLRYAALRYFNVAGADPQARMGQRVKDATHLIKVCCQAALGTRPEVSVFGTDYPTPDGSGVRDYIHIEDLASAHLAALSYLERGGESTTLNVGYGRGSSVREVIEVVQRVSGVRFPVSEAPRRPGDPAMLVARAERIRKVLDWTPSFQELETIVTDAWRWEQELVSG